MVMQLPSLLFKDMSCKRNAFMMLIHADQDRALNYLSSCIEQVLGKSRGLLLWDRLKYTT